MTETSQQIYVEANDLGSDEAAKDVEAVFRDEGFDPDVKPQVYARYALDQLEAWQIVVTAVISGLAGAAANDFYSGLKRAFGRFKEMYRPSPGKHGTVLLQDRESRTSFAVETDLPDGALDAIPDVDVWEHAGESLRWDRERSKWRPAKWSYKKMTWAWTDTPIERVRRKLPGSRKRKR